MPEGISAKIDDESAIITISGATGQDHPDGDFNYRLAAYITEKDSIVFNGTISVKHKKFTTTLVAIENETQDVVAGDAIKPIVFRYAHMQNATVDGILEGDLLAVHVIALDDALQRVVLVLLLLLF